MNETRGAELLAETDRLKLILEEGGQLKPFDLDAEQITIGRTADNAVRISDALSSRHHCQIRRGDAGGWLVQDLKSRNGTKLNGEPLTSERVLAPGDRIEVGDSIVHFGEKKGAAGKGPSVKTKRREKPEGAPPAAAGGPTGEPLREDDGASLVIEKGGPVGQKVKLAPLPFVIGRKKGSGLALDDADVSNEHCMVVEDGGVLHLVDLGSTNGTFLDGERLRGRAPLRRGSLIGVGPSLELRVGAGAAVPKSDRHERPAKPTSDRTAKEPPKSDRTAKEPPKSDRHDRPKARDEGVGAQHAAPRGAAAREARKDAPKPAAVEEVADLDALDAEDEPAAEAKKAKRAAAPASPADTSAAELIAGEGDVAPADFTARLEKAATDGQGSGGGGAALVVVALLLVLGAVGATAATTLVARPEGDPRPADGLVENWSFEDGAARGEIPGWEVAADGASLVQDGVVHGKRALAVQAAPGSRPEVRTKVPVRVSGDRSYRVRAAVALDPHIGAALRVDWSAEDDPSFQRTSWAVVRDPQPQATGGWLDLGGTVAAPRGATLARVTAVALTTADGPAGRARFDRVHLAAVEEAAPRFELDGPAGLSLRLDERGVASLHREGRELAAELALAVDPADPLAHQRAARVDQPIGPQPDESLLALGAIPGPGARLDYAFSAAPGAGGVRLRWSCGPRAAPLHLVFLVPRLADIAPLELDGKDVSSAPPGEPVAVSEMAWGKAARQVSFRFTAPSTLTLRKVGQGAELSFAVPPRPIATGESGVGVDIGAASTGTLDQQRALFGEAEAATAAGDHARALDCYRRLMTRFAHDPAVVARARAGTDETLRRAERLAEVAGWAQQEAQELPVPPLVGAARSAVDELERGFAGTPQLDKARRELARAEEALANARRAEQAARVRELLAQGQRLREAGHVHLARLIYQGIIDHTDDAVPGVADAKAKLAALPPGGDR